MIGTAEEIERGNSRARERSGEFEYWSHQTTIEKLSNAQERFVEHPATRWPAWKSIEIKVDGRWYRLGSTDLMDDVRISGSILELQGMVPALPQRQFT